MTNNNMDLREQIRQNFLNNLDLMTIYSTSELDEITKNAFNGRTWALSSFTYNRWQLGMSSVKDIAPIFIYMDRARYKYVGEKHPFSGKVLHEAKECVTIHVADYSEGCIRFAIEGIKSWDQYARWFDDFKEDSFSTLNSRIVCRNSIVTVKDGDTKRKYAFQNQNDHACQVIDPNKQLGKNILGNKIGHQFQFGGRTWTILQFLN